MFYTFIMRNIDVKLSILVSDQSINRYIYQIDVTDDQN